MIKRIVDVLFKLCIFCLPDILSLNPHQFKNGKFQAIGTHEINFSPLSTIVNTKTGHVRMFGESEPETVPLG